MRWYFRISHPYLIPLPQGDPQRSCEMEALVEEDSEKEKSIVADLVVANSRIRQIAASLLRGGELANGSRAKEAMDEMYSIANYALRYRRMGGGGPAT
ncbi:hypothetical protein A2U01_0010888 [Trifolium medium]|uniref:Uncharacterized protein n=1 Tax=Trifolium medium TaxID=97028 RepID=A0A392MRV5_9FABA|nr:hypothetical protein [Trifolium medium]